MPPGHLVARLLGVPTFAYRGLAVSPSPVKARALLAFLAGTRGEATRRDLAELLWAGHRVGSVHQALHTLRRERGGAAWLSRGPGPVSLLARSDVATFERLVARGRSGRALALWRGTPYDGLRVPGAPAFEDWLQIERLRLEDVRRAALRSDAERLEHAGDAAVALERVHTLLSLDGLDESAHRAAVRLHLAVGDLRAARAAFEACRRILAAELGVEPLAETRELGDALTAAERSIALRPDRGTLAAVPPALVRPPLVGRRAALRRLEATWDAGLVPLVLAPGGMGKTRLALDAAGRRGSYLRVEGRSGDDGVPWASLARAAERVLAELPGLEIPAWVAQELERLAPGVSRRGDPGDRPGSDASRPPQVALRRVRQAFAALLAAARESVRTIVVDDLHAFDDDSREVVVAALASASPSEGALLVAAREMELDDGTRDALLALVEAGRAEPVSLDPLGVDAVDELLRPYGAGAVLARDLVRYTGGNPLFVTEMLRTLHADGRLARGAPRSDDLRAPARIGTVIARRLERLDRAALRVVRVVALDPDAGIDFVAEVLDLDAHDVADAIGVLEDAHLLAEGALAHDVVADVVREHAPESVRRVLHRRIAEALADRGGAPGRIAWHFVAAGAERDALPILQAAAEAAIRVGPSARGRAWLGRVLEQTAPTSEPHARALLWAGVADADVSLEEGAAQVRAALRLAEDHGYGALAQAALVQLAAHARSTGDLRAADGFLADASRRSSGAPSPDASRERLRVAFKMAWGSGDFAAARRALGALDAHGGDRAHEFERGTLDWHVGRFGAAAERFARLAEADGEARPNALHMLGLALWSLGHPERAGPPLERSLATYRGAGHHGGESLARSTLSLVRLAQGRFAEVVALAGVAEELLAVHGSPLYLADVRARRAAAALYCDEASTSVAASDGGLDALQGVVDPFRRSALLSVRAGGSAVLGDHAAAERDSGRALALAEGIEGPLARCVAERAVSIVALRSGDGERAAAHAARAARRSRRHGMAESLAHALVLEARGHETGDRRAAWRAADAARTIAEERRLPHVAWLAASVLGRVGDDRAERDEPGLAMHLARNSPSGRLLEP